MISQWINPCLCKVLKPPSTCARESLPPASYSVASKGAHKAVACSRSKISAMSAKDMSTSCAGRRPHGPRGRPAIAHARGGLGQRRRNKQRLPQKPMHAAPAFAGALIERDDAVLAGGKTDHRRLDHPLAPQHAKTGKDFRTGVFAIAPVMNNVKPPSRDRGAQ